MSDRDEVQIASIGRGLLWLVWQALRLPILVLLIAIEPIVRVALSWISLLAIIVALVFESSGVAPTFPFWGMIAFSISCILALAAYYALLCLLSK